MMKALAVRSPALPSALPANRPERCNSSSRLPAVVAICPASIHIGGLEQSFTHGISISTIRSAACSGVIFVVSMRSSAAVGGSYGLSMPVKFFSWPARAFL